jgi:hypothetical protein
VRGLAAFGGVLMAVGAVLIVRVVALGAILVMPESHALPRRNGGHALNRYRKGQQQDRNKTGN